MNKAVIFALLIACTTPAWAQSSIKGIELSPEDAARVQRQCDALRAQSMRSLGSSEPEEPPADVIVGDAASYWADNADGMDETLSRINLGALTLRDCREAGFY